jgi:hypothetical protein
MARVIPCRPSTPLRAGSDGEELPTHVPWGFLAALGMTVVLFLSCHGPTDPDDPASGPHGRLSGIVTIGPNCPVEQPGMPCPTPPSAYSLRKILVFNSTRSRQLFTVDIDSTGAYLIDLAPATYVIDIRGVGLDRSNDVPKTVTIRANVVTRVDIRIDTGLR